MSKLRKLERLHTKAIDTLERLVDDGNTSAGAFSNILPKLQDAMDGERERAGLREDRNLEIVFVEPDHD